MYEVAIPRTGTCAFDMAMIDAMDACDANYCSLLLDRSWHPIAINPPARPTRTPLLKYHWSWQTQAVM
jgi:hypothetical protein